jgi:oleate hydratase
MPGDANKKAYIIGGGIAGLATAVFLITDGGMKGENIFIYDQNPESGGSLDEQGNPQSGYLCRGYRLFERTIYSTTFDLLSKIPSPDNSGRTLEDDFFEFNKKVKVNSRARLIKEGKVIEAHHLGLNWGDRFKLIKLLFYSENFYYNKKVEDYFSSDFFKSNFWLEWATTFSFEPWHGLVEMKRYLGRFIHDAPYFDTMSCTLNSPYSEHDFMILPILTWLRNMGVNLIQNNTVTDLEFLAIKGQKEVISLLAKDKVEIKKNDLVFLTSGSITEDSSVGSMNKAPILKEQEISLWNMWRDVVKDFSDLGNPDSFCLAKGKTQWESFTLTFSNSVFFDLMENLTKNKVGTGGPHTFKGSNWLLSIILPHQPFFRNQSVGTFVCWGYGLVSNQEGNYVKKKMTECSGEEILKEVCFHLGFVEQMPEIIKSAICIPVLMPYITSQFSLRKRTDRPEVVPRGSVNFACIGQYVEISDEITFTVEQSVRSAKIAVKKLLKLKNKIPPIYQGKYNPWYVIRAILTVLR